MRLTDISIQKSHVMKAWCMEVTMMTPNGEMRSTQHFDDFGGFLTAVKDMAMFFAVRLGKAASVDANKISTRPIAPNRDGLIQ